MNAEHVLHTADAHITRIETDMGDHPAAVSTSMEVVELVAGWSGTLLECSRQLRDALAYTMNERDRYRSLVRQFNDAIANVRGETRPVFCVGHDRVLVTLHTCPQCTDEQAANVIPLFGGDK